MKFDKAHFIAKFTAIPDELWRCDGLYGSSTEGKHCALGHCRWFDQESCNETEEGRALQDLFHSHLADLLVIIVNDGQTLRFPQETPKARILAALNELPD